MGIFKNDLRQELLVLTPINIKVLERQPQYTNRKRFCVIHNLTVYRSWGWRLQYRQKYVYLPPLSWRRVVLAVTATWSTCL